MLGATTYENNTRRISLLLRGLKGRMSSCNVDRKRVIHSIKVGIALVLISLLYVINAVFKQVGENVMWAVMTVVVMFEFYAGATLGKGINRGIGTIVGGGLGCLIVILADKLGGIGKPVAIATSVFIFGCGVTYCRTIPSMKKKYDYGLMISILTFSLVAISGVQDNTDNIVKVALDRLGTIGMGFVVCVSVSLFIFPIWASDQLHCSTASKFEKLSIGIEGCLDEYLRMENEKGNQESSGSDYIQGCRDVLNSKSNDESLVNMAKWEPWHGKFGVNHPWQKYIEIGKQLGELASNILSLYHCIQSPKQPLPMQRQALKEPCENFSLSIKWILNEVGEGINKMELCRPEYVITPKLKSIKLQLALKLSSTEVVEVDEKLAIATLNFLLLEIVERIEKLVKTIQELGEAANFKRKNICV